MSLSIDDNIFLEQCGLIFSSEEELKSSPLLNTDFKKYLHECRDGGFTFFRDGRYLHSRYNPVQEAFRQAENVNTGEDEQLILFFGAGLGYSIDHFLQNNSKSCIWFEPDMEILAAALHIQDVREPLRSGRLIIIPGMPSEDILTDLFRGRGNRQIQFVIHRASFMMNPDYDRIRRFCENFLNRKDVNLATISRFDRLWAKNITANFIHLTEARPVSLLFNQWQNSTSIVCGAGPSLSSSIETIRELRDSSILIAVDTALKILNDAGIDPHIVVSVDPQALNHHYLEGYSGNAIFVVDPTTSYLSLRMLPPERVYYTASPFPLADLFFEHLSVEPGEIAFGGSVSTNAYDLAIKIGSKRILFFGQDLSFTGGLAHAKGAILEENLNYKESRTFRRELHNYRQMTALPVKTLPGIGGGTVKTNDKMLIFYRWFENRFQNDLKNGIEIINLTKKGALFNNIKNSLLTPLGENEEMCFKGPLPIPKNLINKNAKTYFNRESFYASLQELSKNLKRFSTLAKQGADLSDSLFAIVKKGEKNPAYDRLFQQMSEVDQQTKEELQISRIVGSAMQRIILHITENFGDMLTEEEKERPELLVARQSQLLYTGLKEACALHLKWIQKTIRIYEN